MTRVVDGVNRSASDARPQASAVNQPMVRVVRSAARDVAAERQPMQPLRPQRAGSRIPRGRLDGVRVSMPTPSARPLATSQPIARMSAPRPMTPVPKRLPLRAVLSEWVSTGAWRKPAAALAMVLVAFVASGVVVRSLSASRSTARAEQVVATPAVTPAATPAATPTASPAPTVAPTTKPAPLANVPSFGSAQALVDAFVAQNPGAWGIMVKDMRSGEVATYDATRSMTSASLYKMYVAYKTYQKIDLGKYTYEQAAATAGHKTGRTIRECLNLMITVSDNPCGQALIDMLGYGAQDQALAVEGYGATSLATLQRTSAQDMALMFERIYNGNLLSPDSNGRLLTLLKSQRVNNRLPLGVPRGTVMAHKTGDLYGYMHDAGIIYGPKTDYVVVVMSGPWKSPGTAPTKFGKLSSWLWNYFEN